MNKNKILHATLSLSKKPAEGAQEATPSEGPSAAASVGAVVGGAVLLGLSTAFKHRSEKRRREREEIESMNRTSVFGANVNDVLYTPLDRSGGFPHDIFEVDPSSDPAAASPFEASQRGAPWAPPSSSQYDERAARLEADKRERDRKYRQGDEDRAAQARELQRQRELQEQQRREDDQRRSRGY